MRPVTTQTLPEKLGWLTLYFLRRLALAHKDGKNDEATSYSSALFEATIVSVIAPFGAIFSSLLLSSLKWAPDLDSKWSRSSLKLTEVMVGLLFMALGGIWLNRRFKQYRNNPAAWSRFATEEDYRLVFWQKIAIMTTCAVIVPILAFAATLLTL